MSYSEKDVERLVIKILTERPGGLQFEELRNELESVGVYIDSLSLRKIIANMVKNKIVCKEVSTSRRKFLLNICGNYRSTLNELNEY